MRCRDHVLNGFAHHISDEMHRQSSQTHTPGLELEQNILAGQFCAMPCPKFVVILYIEKKN
jgi:hypothetical protein